MIILIYFLLIGLFCFITYEIIHYIIFFITSHSLTWDDPRQVKDNVTMSWKEVRDYYVVNPSRWAFCKSQNVQDIKHLYYHIGNDNHYAVIISFPAYMKLLWYNNFGNPLTPRKQKVLEVVQSDIEVLREKAQAELDEANRISKKVQENLRSGKE